MSQPPSKDRIAPVLPVTDIVAASHYFRDKLGFTIEQAGDSDWGWAVVSRETSTILLVPKDWPLGCSIRVDNVDAVAAELAARKVVFESGPTNQGYGERDFAVQGPEGYNLQFWEPLKDEEESSSDTNKPLPDRTKDGSDSIPF